MQKKIDILKVLGLEEEKRCEFCGCSDGIHKSDCRFIKRLDGY